MEETKGRIAIGAADKAHLEKAAKWAKFIAIVQFIFIGLGIIIALIVLLAGGIAGASLSEMSGVPGGAGDILPAGFFIVYGIFLIVALAVSFFITLLLYRFAAKTLQAIAAGDDGAMTAAFENLGKYFKIQGILLIISLAIIPLLIIIMSISLASAMPVGGF